MANRSCKAALRRTMRQKRDLISPLRRAQASRNAFKALLEKVPSRSFTLSYASINSELSLVLLNRYLAATKSLVLPFVQNHELKLYLVHDLDKQVRISPWGIVEPNPEVCQEVAMQQIDLALIPALAFDGEGHRLGYGKGFYDRLLSNSEPEMMSIGIGFTEQLLSAKLPVDPHDKPVTSLALF